MTENGAAVAPPDDDRTPTQADAELTKPADEWVMPEPVFRQSEGLTPQYAARGNEDQTLTPDMVEPPIDVAADDNFAATTPEIAEQPHVSEDLISDSPPAQAVPVVTGKKKSGFVKVLLVLLGIVLAIAIAAAAIIALGLGYLFRISESQNLN
jgi:hypothetical protein